MNSVHQDEPNEQTAISQLKEIPYNNVLLAIAAGAKIGQACKDAGISRTALFEYVKQHPDVIGKIVAPKRAEIQALYSDVADTERKAIETYLRRVDVLLEDPDNLKLSELEATINYLSSMRSHIEDSLGASEKAQDPGAPYLEGINLKKVTRTTTETITYSDDAIDAIVTET